MISAPIVLAITIFVTHAQLQYPSMKPQILYLPALVLLFSGLFVTYHFMIGIIVVFLICYLSILAIAERSFNRLLVDAKRRSSPCFGVNGDAKSVAIACSLEHFFNAKLR